MEKERTGGAGRAANCYDQTNAVQKNAYVNKFTKKNAAAGGRAAFFSPNSSIKGSEVQV